MSRLRAGVLLALLAATSVPAEVVDNCASLLGSIGVELRYARQLPAGARTTFSCPRETAVLVAASRQRVLAALGSPDETTTAGDVAGASWTYWFGPRPRAGEARPGGQPGLRFDFDATFAVQAVACEHHP
jgi:hypothetical protein